MAFVEAHQLRNLGIIRDGAELPAKRGALEEELQPRDHPDRDVGLLYFPGPGRTPATQRLRAYVAVQFQNLAATIQHHEQQMLWRR